MEERRKALPHQRFTLTRQDRRVTVNYSVGDYKVLSYMAAKEHKTIVEMAHELFTMGLECKLHGHRRRLTELEKESRGILIDSSRDRKA